MFKRLLELKSFCIRSATDIKELHIGQSDWLEIENICDILQPVYEMAIKFQKKDLLLSDVFFGWISVKTKIEKMSGELCTFFAAALKSRGEILLHNPCILASVYLDPRYQILLSESQKSIAKKHLKQVYVMNSLISPTQSYVEESPMSKASSDDELEDILKQLEKEEKEDQNKSIKDVIQSFNNVKRLPLNTDVLNFWKHYPIKQLRDFAEIVFGIPATQVSVERAFSTLKYVLSDLRANIEDDLLEDILLINLN